MVQKGPGLLGVCALALCLAWGCSPEEPVSVASAPRAVGGGANTSAGADMGAAPDAGDGEASAPFERWTMPAYGARAPDFPYLEGEARGVSRSVGSVAHGYLVDGVEVPLPHPRVQVLDVQVQRGLMTTSGPMWRLIEGAAQEVQREHPDAIVYLGNLSAPGGGDIIYSVSHNSGRDADVAFFVTDEQGRPAVMPDLLELDQYGRYEGEHGVYLFDIERNWSLVRAMLKAPGGDTIQFIFVADWLKDMLIDWAKERGEDEAIVSRARQVLRQPGASLPHNDHFHVRILCSARDVASGCVNSRMRRGETTHREALSAATAKARAALKSKDPEVRRAGVERLVVLEDRRAVYGMGDLLKDEDEGVRVAAARAMGELGVGDRALAWRARFERSPRVMVELIDALGRVGGERAAKGLARFLRKDHPLELDDEVRVDARLLAIDQLGKMGEEVAVEPLIKLLKDRDGEVAARAALALRELTNHQLYAGDWREANRWRRRKLHKQWEAWFDEHGKKRRREWLVLGFQREGFKIHALDKKHIWPLCYAIASDAPHISLNARRILGGLSGNAQDTLGWSVADAAFYWKRWFTRRRRRFRLPKPPARSKVVLRGPYVPPGR